MREAGERSGGGTTHRRAEEGETRFRMEEKGNTAIGPDCDRKRVCSVGVNRGHTECERKWCHRQSGEENREKERTSNSGYRGRNLCKWGGEAHCCQRGSLSTLCKWTAAGGFDRASDMSLAMLLCRSRCRMGRATGAPNAKTSEVKRKAAQLPRCLVQQLGQCGSGDTARPTNRAVEQTSLLCCRRRGATKKQIGNPQTTGIRLKSTSSDSTVACNCVCMNSEVPKGRQTKPVPPDPGGYGHRFQICVFRR